MRTLYRIWQNALMEWTGAVRSRRALVLLALYLVFAVGCMYVTISILGKMEVELAKLLQLPASDQTGVVSATLWKSKPFQRMIHSAVSSELVYTDIVGRHPVVLMYGFFAFFFAPLLVMLVSGNRIADDLRSGAVRYSIVRSTRAEWTLGKYLGQALMIALALAISAVGAWVVAVCRLSGTDVWALLPSMLDWGLRAWIYSLAWIGIALGCSHCTRSGSWATVFGILLMVALASLSGILKWVGLELEIPWIENFGILAPSSVEGYLWRRSFAPLAVAAFHLLSLGFAYLALGYAFFRRRDA